jgi:hypothetical protein
VWSPFLVTDLGIRLTNSSICWVGSAPRIDFVKEPGHKESFALTVPAESSLRLVLPSWQWLAGPPLWKWKVRHALRTMNPLALRDGPENMGEGGWIYVQSDPISPRKAKRLAGEKASTDSRKDATKAMAPLSASGRHFPGDHCATSEEILQAQRLIGLVKPQMADAQVFDTLRLSHCYAYGNGAGDTGRFHLRYDMLNGHGVTVVRDLTVPVNSSLISVSVDGATWPRDVVSTH